METNEFFEKKLKKTFFRKKNENFAKNLLNYHFSDKLLFFTPFDHSYDQNPNFFSSRYCWNFQNWKIFEIETKIRPTALFKILTKKIQKLVFCLFFAIFCKIFIFFRKHFFFNFFSKNSFILLGSQRKYSWIFRSKPQIFQIFQKNQCLEQMHGEMKGFGQKTIFRWYPAKTTGGGRLPATKNPIFGKLPLKNWFSTVKSPSVKM